MPRKTDFKISLGTRIKLLRNANLLTQEELGKKLDVGKSTIANYESGYSEPEIEKLKKIADIFNVSLDYLLGNTTIQNPINMLEEKLSLLNLTEEELNSAINDVLYYYSNSDNIINPIPDNHFKTKNEQIAFQTIQFVIADFFGNKLEHILGEDYDLFFPHTDKDKPKLLEVQNYIKSKILSLANSLDRSKIIGKRSPLNIDGLDESDIEKINDYIKMYKLAKNAEKNGK